MRFLLAALIGAGATVASAVVLGDYPLSGSVPWAAAVVIPLIIGSATSLTAGRRRAVWWVAAGPLSAGAMAWGVRIATGYGLDPVPLSCWIAGAIALAWPPVFGLLSARRAASMPVPTDVGPEPISGSTAR